MRIQSHFNSIEGRVSQSLGVTRPVPVAFKLLARCRINLEHWQLRIGSDSAPPRAWAHNLKKTVGRQHGAASHPAGMATKEFDILPPKGDSPAARDSTEFEVI